MVRSNFQELQEEKEEEQASPRKSINVKLRVSLTPVETILSLSTYITTQLDIDRGMRTAIKGLEPNLPVRPPTRPRISLCFSFVGGGDS